MAEFVAGQKVKLVRDFEPDRRTEAPSDGILLPALGEIYTVRSVGYEPEFGSILFLEEIVNETKFYLDAFKVMEQGFDPTRFQLVDPSPSPNLAGQFGPRGMSIDQINALILDLEQELRRRDGTLKPDNPMSFFMQSVDSWGAAEWFDRLANAIRKQDEAAVAMHRASEEDKVLREADFDLYRMIAHSSAMRLVRDYEPQVRAALATTEGQP